MSRGRIILGLLPGLVTAATLLFLFLTGRWTLFGIWPEAPVYGGSTSFADLAYSTAVADCMVSAADVTNCDPYGRPFQPYTVIPSSFLAVVRIGLPQTGYLGFGLAALWVGVICVSGLLVMRRWRRSTGEALLAILSLTLVAIAPPAVLGVERGQLEILVIASAMAGLLLTGRKGAENSKLVQRALGSLALFFSVILKYLAIGVFLAYLAPRRWRWWAGAALLASIAFLAFNFGDLQIARETARAEGGSTSRVMFSATTAIVTFLVEDPAAFSPADPSAINFGLVRVIGLAIFIALIVLFVWLLSRVRTNMPELAETSWYLLIGGLGAVAVPFVLGDSNDYRLMFLALALTGLLVWIGVEPHTPTRRLLWSMVAFITLGSLTSATMIPNEFGFLMPRHALIAGDLLLTAVLAFGAALWIRSLWNVRTYAP